MEDKPGQNHHNTLQLDLEKLLRTGLSRRRLLELGLAGSASILAGGCNSDGIGAAPNPTLRAAQATATRGDEQCVLLPQETAGPYPSDGSNRIDGTISNVLAQSGVVRQDISRSFGNSNTKATGTAFSLKIRLLDSDCLPVAGYALYLWHCTVDGKYSLYNRGVEQENYLRGIQVSDDQGYLSFNTIFPGCYPGRYPHFHFEVYRSLELSSLYKNCLLTSQIALPKEACENAYASVNTYQVSAKNLAGLSIARDGVFRNNSPKEITAMTLLTSKSAAGYVGDIDIGLAI